MGITLVDLPSDLIATIVTELKSRDDFYSDHIYPHGTLHGSNRVLFRNLRLEWMVSTQFCRHWRQAAIDCASLWSHIDVSYWSDNMITMFLERSKESALSLVMSLPLQDEDRQMLKYRVAYQASEEEAVIPNRFNRCLENLYRTRSLAITVGGRAPWCFRVLEILETTEMPALEHFALDGYVLRFVGPLTLKNAPFNNSAPNLRSLALRSVSLPSESAILRPSESLLLELVVCRGTQSLDDILRPCSSLTDLNIDSVKAVDNDGQFIPLGDQPVILPHLKSFSVCGSTMLCDTFSRICIYPPEAQSNVSYMFIEGDDTLPRCPPSFQGRNVRAWFNVMNKSMVEVQWGSASKGAGYDIKYSFGMQKTANNSSDYLWSFGSLVDILKETSLTIEEFTILVENSVGGMGDSWRRLFKSMDSLVSLTIRSDHDYLQSFAEAVENKGSDAYTLPNLSDLTIISHTIILPESLHNLKESLLSRQRGAKRLRSLRLRYFFYVWNNIDDEEWASTKKNMVNILQPLADLMEVTKITDVEANAFVDPDSFRICRRMRRYGRKTEFRA